MRAAEATDPFFLEVRRQLIQNLVFFSGIVFSQKLFSLRALFLAVVGYAFLSAMTIFVRAVSYSLAGGHTLPPSDFVNGLFKSKRIVPYTLGFGALVLLSLFFGRAYFLLTLGILIVGLLHDLFFRALPLLDVLTIAGEFVGKAAAGALILGLPTSSWLVICTFLLALLISIGQRRNEIHLLEEAHQRPVLRNYSPPLLNQMLAVAASATLMAYSLYTVDPRTIEHLGTANLVYTLPIVLYGVMRYLFLVYTRDISEGIERYTLRDTPLKLCILTWAVVVVLLVY